MRHWPVLNLALLLPAVPLLSVNALAQSAPLQFAVQLPSGSTPYTGRLIVCIAKPDEAAAPAPGHKADPAERPCLGIDESFRSNQGFGIDLEAAAPGSTVTVGANAFGYPIRDLAALPAGKYRVEAILNRYEQFHLADGRTPWLPPDKGEGQHWSTKPGNPSSEVQTMTLDGHSGATINLRLDRELPAVAPIDPDSKYLKHLTIRSEKLSKFWGRDTSIQAMVLLPAGFDEHPDAHYPVVVWQDHFQAHFRAITPWRDTPPDPAATGGAKLVQTWAWHFYNDWTGGILPHVILVVLNHANPYYDDSYAVNSANLGPYGDAITQEVIPEIEHRYHGLGAGWARGTLGGSTGGWEALAQQIFYPDFYNGAWGFCPDPVDFHAYQVTDLYGDSNAYFRTGPFESVPTPSDREGDGRVTAEMDQVNHYELLLGTHGRSGEQYDIWQAVFSPAGADGYPAPVYDKLTGDIHAPTVDYWKQHYDLNAILARDWPSLGPKLEGKLHLAVGLSDTYYLNNAVHLMQQNLDATQHPHSDATFDYGPWAPHCYTGTLPDWDQSHRLDVEERVLPVMVQHMLATAPAGADLKSWQY